MSILMYLSLNKFYFIFQVCREKIFVLVGLLAVKGVAASLSHHCKCIKTIIVKIENKFSYTSFNAKTWSI